MEKYEDLLINNRIRLENKSKMPIDPILQMKIKK